jgi:hypothetical protein
MHAHAFSLRRTPKRLGKWHGQDGNTGCSHAGCLATFIWKSRRLWKTHKKVAYLVAGALLPVMRSSLWSISGVVLELESCMRLGRFVSATLTIKTYFFSACIRHPGSI